MPTRLVEPTIIVQVIASIKQSNPLGSHIVLLLKFFSFAVRVYITMTCTCQGIACVSRRRPFFVRQMASTSQLLQKTRNVFSQAHTADRLAMYDVQYDVPSRRSNGNDKRTMASSTYASQSRLQLNKLANGRQRVLILDCTLNYQPVLANNWSHTLRPLVLCGSQLQNIYIPLHL